MGSNPGQVQWGPGQVKSLKFEVTIYIYYIFEVIYIYIWYNFYRYSENVNSHYLNVGNKKQKSFWHLFWHRVPYFVVLKSIARTFLLKCTIDCCVLYWACT